MGHDEDLAREVIGRTVGPRPKGGGSPGVLGWVTTVAGGFAVKWLWKKLRKKKG